MCSIDCTSSSTWNDGPETPLGGDVGWDTTGCEITPICPPRSPHFSDVCGAEVFVRPLQEEDICQLVTMYEMTGSTTLGLPPETRKEVIQWIRHLSEKGWNLIARDGEDIVGHIGITPADASIPEFVVFVDDEHQGRGIGTELVKQAIAYATEKGHEALTLTVHPGNRRAISVYTQTGFEVIERSMYIHMRIELPPRLLEKPAH